MNILKNFYIKAQFSCLQTDFI